jgi:preprotein translocase subunit SecE
VSDQREGAGAAGDGDETTTGRGPTAVATRPLRPTGKRSRQATTTVAEEIEETAGTELGVTKNGATTKVKTAKKRPRREKANPLVFVWVYLRQVVAEMRKVIWPNRKQMVSYTTVVIFFLAFMVALIGVVDLGLGKLVLSVFG